MKRLILIVTLLVIAALTACSQDAPGSSSQANENCNKHGCVSIEIEQPVQAMKPANLRIKVSSTQKTDHLAVSLTIYGMESLKIEKLPEPTRIVQYKDLGVSIVIDAEAGQEYVIEGVVVLAQPEFKTSKHTYSFNVVLVHPLGNPIWVTADIYLDDDGYQMDTERVRELSGTEEEILPEVTGIIIFPTDTPYPTFPPPTPVPSATPMPTRTPTPTRTATQAPYP
ncbi:MAG: hypothetical protein ROW48_06145 [Bellilinea sp.]|jgi:hypothetical protein